VDELDIIRFIVSGKLDILSPLEKGFSVKGVAFNLPVRIDVHEHISQAIQEIREEPAVRSRDAMHWRR
jgi:hypothetical protein